MAKPDSLSVGTTGGGGGTKMDFFGMEVSFVDFELLSDLFTPFALLADLSDFWAAGGLACFVVLEGCSIFLPVSEDLDEGGAAAFAAYADTDMEIESERLKT